MFSRKRITRTVSSFLIVLMFMALIPFIDSGDVLAEPDKEEAETIELHESVSVEKGVGSKTVLFHAPHTMKYRFTLFVRYEERCDFVSDDNNVAMYVYDSNDEVIASAKGMPHDRSDIVVELNANEDYYIYIDPDVVARHYTLHCEYDYEIDFKVKGKADSDYKVKYSSYTSSIYGQVCDTYELNDSDSAKADLAIGSLLDGMKLNYEWFVDYKTEGKNYEKIGSPNSPITIQNPLRSTVAYKCSIKSTDGKFSDELYIKVVTLNTYTFLDGSKVAYAAFAYKPGEDRTITFPETIYNGDLNDKKSYYFHDDFIHSSTKMGSNEATVNIPSSWKGTYILAKSYRGYNNWLKGDFLCFVFEDGAGIKAENSQTYHIDRNSFAGDYRQVIYSFTPETSGMYRFNTSNVKYGYSVIAIFDSDRNTVATSLADYIENSNSRNTVQTFDIKAELTGGKTYYIAIPAAISYLECDLSISKTSDSPSTPTPSTTGGTFEDFVERLYVVALGRASEAEGKAHWCKVVGNGSYSGADCARFFLTSPEFNGRNLNNEEYLKVLYKTFFDRDAAADPDGFNFWLSKIDEWGRARVLEGFIDSTEWCNICASYGVRSGAMTAKATVASQNATDFATRLYTECLGREAEEGGLKYWSLSLTNLERTGTQAAKEFFYSEEFLSKNLSNEEYIMRLYGTFMGRTPEADGKAYWLDLLNKGGSRDEVFNFFASCPEFTEICTKYAIDR